LVVDVDVDISTVVILWNVIVIAAMVVSGDTVVNIDVAVDGGKTDDISGASVIS
jgi:hypothetical protein